MNHMLSAMPPGDQTMKQMKTVYNFANVNHQLQLSPGSSGGFYL